MKPRGPVVSAYETESYSPSRWNPRNWSRRIWLIIATAIIIIVVAIVGAVVGVRAARNNNGSNSANDSYPDYKQLNYTLVDTCKSQLSEGCSRLCSAVRG